MIPYELHVDLTITVIMAYACEQCKVVSIPGEFITDLFLTVHDEDEIMGFLEETPQATKKRSKKVVKKKTKKKIWS